jgi:hypothetical protein
VVPEGPKEAFLLLSPCDPEEDPLKLDDPVEEESFLVEEDPLDWKEEEPEGLL